MPTIKDIAKLAGVSHGTVSNVLNKTGKVSADKIRRVEEAARQLGYVPNKQAQLLRQGAANLIAIILPTILEKTYCNFYLALQYLAQKNGFRTELYQTSDIRANEEQVLSSLPLPSLAAIISIPTPGAQCCSAYENMNCPIIFVNREQEIQKKDCVQVLFDFSQAGKEISAYIQKHHWKNAAFFSTSGDPSDEKAIFNSLCAFLESPAVSLQKFTSNSHLIINHAFDLLTQATAFDGVVTVGSLRSDAVESALRFLNVKPECEVLCIGSAQTFPKSRPCIYEMDYSSMAMKIMDILSEHLYQGKPLPVKIILPFKGFSFSLPRISHPTEETLSMLTLESPTTTALEQFSPFLREMTGINLKITAMSYDDLYAQINLLSAQSHYDLIRMDMAWMNRFASEIYMPLSQSGAKDSQCVQEVIQNAHPGYTHCAGTLYALPFDPSVQILLYRQDLFENAVLQRTYYEAFKKTLEVPKTIDDWFCISRFFTHSYFQESPTLYGTSLTTGNAASAVCDFLPHYFAKGGKLYDEKGLALFNTPLMREALKEYKNRQNYTKPAGELWWRDSVRQFADGNTATVLTFSNHAAYFMNNRYTNIVGKIGAAVIPGGSPLLGGGVIGISKYSKKVAFCCRFFDWLYHRDIASAIVRLGGASPIREAYFSYDNYSAFPWLETIGKTFSVGTRGTDGVYVPEFSALDYEAALGTAVYRMIHNDLSPDRAVELAQQLYDQKRPRRLPMK